MDLLTYLKIKSISEVFNRGLCFDFNLPRTRDLTEISNIKDKRC